MSLVNENARFGTGWKRLLRFGLRSILMLMLVAGVVFASESNHHSRQAKVIDQLGINNWHGEARYRWLDSDRFKWMDKVFGPHWNLDIVSVTLNGLSLEENQLLIQDLSRLNRLRILNIYYGPIAKSDIGYLKKMDSLQWLMLINADIDPDSVAKIRQDLPNTFVSYLPDDSAAAW